MTMQRRAFVSVLVAATISSAAADPVREGAGDRRDALDAMELKPFPAVAWTMLSDWTNGEALSPGRTDGKVVLILTWANWNPHSRGAVKAAQRIAEKHSHDDLIVVGVHDARRFNDAAKTAGAGLLLAHDADGSFRQALRVDQDPDFYVIDRAGNLRFADIETASVQDAVVQLVAESRRDADGYPARVLREAAALEALARRSSAVQKELDLSDMPDLTFPSASEQQYTAADWPNRWAEFEKDVLKIRRDNAVDEQADDIRVLTPPEPSENMFGRPPRSFEGRVTVMYFWSPTLLGSYELVQPMMDLLQRERWRDVNVIGVMTRMPVRGRDGRELSAEADDKDRKRFSGLVGMAKRKRTYEHTIVADAEHEIIDALLAGDQFGGRRDEEIARYAAVAVFSSDKILRWVGPPRSSRFRTALEHTLRVDPGVAARRQVEQVWIRERNK